MLISAQQNCICAMYMQLFNFIQLFFWGVEERTTTHHPLPILHPQQLAKMLARLTEKAAFMNPESQ